MGSTIQPALTTIMEMGREKPTTAPEQAYATLSSRRNQSATANHGDYIRWKSGGLMIRLVIEYQRVAESDGQTCGPTGSEVEEPGECR